MFQTILFVGLGGFVGSVLRFLIGQIIPFKTGSFPWGTLAINVLGCLLIGVFFGLAEKEHMLSSNLRLFLTVGLCGGYTTFSTFGNETFLLIQNEQIAAAIAYTLLSVTMGVLAVFLGRIAIAAT